VSKFFSSFARTRAVILSLGIAILLSGCSAFSGSRSQVTQCQQEKEQLLGALRTHRDEVAALRTTNDKLTARLDEAEKEIARGPSNRKFAGWDSSPGNDLARTKPAATVPADPTKEVPAPTAVASQVEVAKLPWKPLRPGAEGDAKFKQLTQQYAWLKQDATAGGLIVDAPVEFVGDGTTLSPASKETLDKLSKLLREGPGKELRIVVAGQTGKKSDAKLANPRQVATQRAAVVADYLDSHGVAGERLAVTAAAPASDEAASTRPLQIHLLEREAPVVGLAPNGLPQRR